MKKFLKISVVAVFAIAAALMLNVSVKQQSNSVNLGALLQANADIVCVDADPSADGAGVWYIVAESYTGQYGSGKLCAKGGDVVCKYHFSDTRTDYWDQSKDKPGTSTGGEY